MSCGDNIARANSPAHCFNGFSDMNCRKSRIARIGWRGNLNERCVGSEARGVRMEGQARARGGHQLGETRYIEWNIAALKGVDMRLVDVNAKGANARACETGRQRQPKLAQSEDAKVLDDHRIPIHAREHRRLLKARFPAATGVHSRESVSRTSQNPR